MLEILIVLVIVGVIVYIVNTMVPMAPPFKALFNAVIAIAMCLWLLRLIGVIHTTRFW